ncbi:PRD domain-containing protein, partial [Bacillus sp. D-CC]
AINPISPSGNVICKREFKRFIALHIYSSLTNSDLSSVNQNSRLIAQLVSLIETNLQITLDQESIHYLRLIRHLQYAIERVKKG